MFEQMKFAIAFFFITLLMTCQTMDDLDDAYYDGDQQEPVRVNLLQTIDCSNQCPPFWTEPVLQHKQTLVFPTSASVSLKCPYYAKPTARITWWKDGQIFQPELYELVGEEYRIGLCAWNVFVFSSQ